MKKFGEEEEFPFPQQDGSFWTPGILQEENQRENADWAELVGIYSEFLQQTDKCAEVQSSSPVVLPERSTVYPTTRIPQNSWTEHQGSAMPTHTRQNCTLQHMSGCKLEFFFRNIC